MQIGRLQTGSGWVPWWVAVVLARLARSWSGAQNVLRRKLPCGIGDVMEASHC